MRKRSLHCFALICFLQVIAGGWVRDIKHNDVYSLTITMIKADLKTVTAHTRTGRAVKCRKLLSEVKKKKKVWH